MFDGDDDTDITLDALDTTLHTSKLAFGDLHSLTRLTGEVEVVEPDHLVALLGGDADEVVHLTVRNIENLRMLGIVGFQHWMHDVAQGFVEGFLLLDPTEIVVSDTDEEEVVDGWGKVHLLCSHLLEAHGDKGTLHTRLFVEECLQPQES